MTDSEIERQNLALLEDIEYDEESDYDMNKIAPIDQKSENLKTPPEDS